MLASMIVFYYVFCYFEARFEAVAVVADLQNAVSVGEAVEQRAGHFSVPKHTGPFSESQVIGDQEADAFVWLVE